MPTSGAIRDPSGRKRVSRFTPHRTPSKIRRQPVCPNLWEFLQPFSIPCVVQTASTEFKETHCERSGSDSHTLCSGCRLRLVYTGRRSFDSSDTRGQRRGDGEETMRGFGYNSLWIIWILTTTCSAADFGKVRLAARIALIRIAPAISQGK